MQRVDHHLEGGEKSDVWGGGQVANQKEKTHQVNQSQSAPFGLTSHSWVHAVCCVCHFPCDYIVDTGNPYANSSGHFDSYLCQNSMKRSMGIWIACNKMFKLLVYKLLDHK